MMRERPIILVDTNIWLDNYLRDRPGSKTSRDFLDKARANGARLTYPMHILADFFFLVQSHLKLEARKHGPLSEADALTINRVAWSCVDNLRDSATAIAADESDAWRACKYRTLTNDLEDNLVLAAAERVPVDFIVTNDQHLLRKSTVNAFTPADAVLLLQTINQQASS